MAVSFPNQSFDIVYFSLLLIPTSPMVPEPKSHIAPGIGTLEFPTIILPEEISNSPLLAPAIP